MVHALRGLLFGTLRRQLIIGVAVAYALIMALFIQDLINRQKQFLLERQVELATALSRSLSASSNHWLAAHDISGLQELVETIRTYPELRFAMLLNEQGQVLAHTDRTRLGQYLQDLPTETQQRVLMRNQILVDVVTPVMMAERHVGWARVGVGQALASQKAARIYRDGILYAIGAIVIGSLMAWFMGRQFTRRLSQIQATMEEVRAGNTQARSSLCGTDEAADLSAGFNTMLDMLAEREDAVITANNALQDQTRLLEQEVVKRQLAQQELETLNEKLEQLVVERTFELNERNQALQQAYDDLKKVQAQLLQQDKMASIGQLAAGVAHEINNPMGFIISNLSSLGKYVQKLGNYLEADEKILAGCTPEVWQLAVQERQKFKVEHIRKDMPDLISESEEGAQRVRQIVQDLKHFSRSDSSEGAFADINAGLESTLSIAWNEIKYKAAVIKNYGPLPLVWCHIGQLNQVFLNILLNAAHAIRDRGEIRISTAEDNANVLIRISDTGEGITSENLKRIFDPFFTTKEVGKGTGLGLAIAYDIIVNKHGGWIDVTSEPGTGTTFTIMLPVQRSGQPDARSDL